MIKYHVLALLCLVAAGLTSIEAAARFTMSKEGFSNPLGWLMVAVCAGSFVLYFRVRKLRKKSFEAGNR